MDSIEFAKALFDESASLTSVNSTRQSLLPKNNTTSITAVAKTDSSNGVVSVEIDGIVCDVDTTVSVKAGDNVIISITGNTPVVTGVIAGGDRTMDAINNLLLKRTNNLLDLSQLDNWEIFVANATRATDFSYIYGNEQIVLTATEQPSTTVEPIQSTDDIDQPVETASGEETIEPEVQTQSIESNANAFSLSPVTTIALDGGYVLTMKLETSGITGRAVVSAVYEREVEIHPTGDEQDQQPVEDIEGDSTGVDEELPEIPSTIVELQSVSEDFISVDIPEQNGDTPVVVEKQFTFVGSSDYMFNITIGDNFATGDVSAKLSLDLQTKEFIDATGAITKATELANEAKESADSVASQVNKIEGDLAGISDDIAEISGTVNNINDAVAPVIEAIEDIKGEADTFKDGLENVIESVASEKFATKNDILEFEANLSSNISQSASRIEFSVSEEDITNILPDAENSIDEAMQAYQGAQAQYQAAQQAYSLALSENIVAATTLENAKSRLDLVEKQVQSIVDNPDISPDDKAAAQKILSDAQDSYDAAYEKASNVETMFRNVEEDLEKAKTILQSSLSKLNECQDSQLVKQAELNVLSDEINTKVSQTTYDANMTEIEGKYTQLTQTADNLQIDFGILSQDVENDKMERLKYIRFVDGNIVLGEQGDVTQLVISGDTIQFMQNGSEIAHIRNDNLFITRVAVTDQLEVNNWKWKQRDNGNISFKYIVTVDG